MVFNGLTCWKLFCLEVIFPATGEVIQKSFSQPHPPIYNAS